jgi:hypothetical protein
VWDSFREFKSAVTSVVGISLLASGGDTHGSSYNIRCVLSLDQAVRGDPPDIAVSTFLYYLYENSKTYDIGCRDGDKGGRAGAAPPYAHDFL